jgi:hypothetical protein
VKVNAENRALEECRKAKGKNCTIQVSQCSSTATRLTR